jgi:hypothetical protein
MHRQRWAWSSASAALRALSSSPGSVGDELVSGTHAAPAPSGCETGLSLPPARMDLDGQRLLSSQDFEQEGQPPTEVVPARGPELPVRISRDHSIERQIPPCTRQP